MKVRLLIVLVMLGLSVGLWGNPNQISTWEDLHDMRDDLAGSYILMNDLNESSAGYLDYNDLETPGWLPIGDDEEPFTGSFDGQGYTISGLYIDRGDTDYVGLFGYLNENATVLDVMLDDVDVTGDGMVGALAGENYGEINDSSANGTVSGDNRVGGLVGRNRGTVDSSYAFVTVYGDHTYIGGLVGTNSGDSIVSNSYAMGDVTGHRYVGGLNGGNWGADSIISNSYATGNVSGDEDIGGLLGGNDDGWVLNCYAKGEVSGDIRVGGLVGYSSGTNILNNIVQNSHATGDVTGNSRIGGLVGRNDRTVENSYATGSVSGTSWNVGGLVGRNTRMVNNSYATGDVNGANRVGGIVGWNDGSGTVHNSYATGDVSGTQDDVGGLVGEHTGWGTVENSFWDIETGGPDNGIGEGKTTAEMMIQSTFTDAGWDFTIPGTWVMAGYPHLQWEHTLEITNVKELQMMKLDLDASYTLMNDLDFSEHVGWDDGELIWNDGAGFEPIGTNNNSFTGVFDGQNHHIYGLKINRPSMDFVGLFGYVRDGEVLNVVMHDVCVIGDRYVGKLVGENWGGTVDKSYATGYVSGSNYVGGLVGFNYYGAVHNSYATGNVSGDDRVGGLVGSIYDGTVEKSYATGNVSGSSQVGGLVGENWFGMVGNAYATGISSGENEVGGLVGRNYDGTVENSYATGTVNGDLDVGGLVGMNSGGTVLNSYATGNVSGDDRVGGLVGSNYGSVSNSFYDTDTTGQIDTWKGTPKTTADMQDINTFSDAGWDIVQVGWGENEPENTWNIVDGDTYPFLGWEEGGKEEPHKVASPTFSPEPGLYTDTIDVSIESATEGATIIYRTMVVGNTRDSWTGWQVYTTPITVPLDTEMDFEAYAEKDDWITSEVSSASYTVTGTVATPTFSPDQGVYTDSIDVLIEVSEEPAELGIRTRRPVLTDRVNHAMRQHTPRLNLSRNEITIYYRTSVSGGAWSDWEAYTEPITIGWDTEMDIEAYAERPYWVTSEIAEASYNVTGTVDDPTITPESGLYTEEVDVMMETETEGATIKYRTSTDGGAWTDWQVNINPITVPLDTEMDFEAYAEKDDWITSETIEATFIVTGTVATPTYSPEPGIYTNEIDVTIETTTDAATIWYRVSADSLYWSDWQVYTDPINIPLDTQRYFQAYAEKDDWITSETVSANYLVTGTVADPTFTPEPGIYTEVTDVEIDTDTEEATLMYRTSTDGGAWTAWQSYTTPITVPLDTEMDFEAYAEKDDWITSDTISANYIVTGTVADPSFSPEPGIFTEATDVSIETETDEATIMYRTSTDGGAWTDWEVYIDPVTVPLDTEMDFEAYAEKDDWITSETVSANYLVTGTVADPIFTPEPGIYTEATDVSIETNTETATIMYRISTDGGTWTAWQSYTTPITVPLDTEMDFEAYAEKDDWVTSETVAANYIVTGTVADPTFTPEPGIYTEATDVSIETDTEAATIMYRTSTDGGAWTDWHIYIDPITVPLDTEMDFEAYAEKDDWITSETAEANYIVTGTVAMPTFSPEPGLYTESADVSIDIDTDGATIMYRTSIAGSVRDSWSEWLEYTDPITVPLDTEMVFEAYAEKDDWITSDTISANYIVTGTVADPTFSPEPGIFTEATDVSIETETDEATIMYRTSTDGGASWSAWETYTDAITVPLDTEMDFEAYAEKDDWINSETAEATYTVTGTVAMPTFSPDAGIYTDATDVSIDTDTEGATVKYRISTDDGTWSNWETYIDPITVPLDTEMDFEAYAQKDDWADSDTAEATYTVTGTVAMPTFSPDAGIYTEATDVEIDTATEGATIMYRISTEGGAWTDWETYTDAITVPLDTEMDFEAYAEKTDWADSDIAEATYTVTGTVATPSFTPDSGLYTEATDVSIETDTEGATIMYRTSITGSVRDTWSDWQEYIDPITVPLNTEMDFEAYAQKEDWVDSDTSEATYIVTGTVAMPTFSPEPGIYTEATDVSIETDTEGATIMYRTSTAGTLRDTWSDWQEYTEPITVPLDTDMDFEAYAQKDDWIASETSEANYIVTGTVATPEFDPEGGVYHEAQVVTISTETLGATIEYSYDGESWIEGDTAEIEYSTMLYARAYLENWVDSEIAEDMYYILHPPKELVSEAGDGYVDLVWQAPIGTRGDSRNSRPRLSEQESCREEHGVIGYNIYRDEEMIASVGLVYNYHDDEVENVVEYTYYVTALYSEGESLPSNTTTAVPLPDIAYGDVDDNGIVEAYDASLVLQYAVGMDPIPQIDPRPWEDWRFIRADVNGDDMIRAYDASLILQYALGIISVFPVQIPVRYQQPEIVDIGWFIDDEYLYLETDNSEELYAAEFIIPDSENISFGEVEFNAQLSEYMIITHTSDQGTHVALAAAIPIEHSDYLFRVPYQSEEYEILTIDVISNVYESSLEIEFLPTETDEPVEFITSLHRAFPNPFNPETNIGFSLADAGHVTIEIFNIRGQKIRTLVNEPCEAGEHNVVWDGRDNHDREVSGGVYLYRFVSRDHIETRRMLLLK